MRRKYDYEDFNHNQYEITSEGIMYTDYSFRRYSEYSVYEAERFRTEDESTELYDPDSGIWWVKCRIEKEDGTVAGLWTAVQRFYNQEWLLSGLPEE